MIKLISLDLDGTLLTPDGKVTAASKEAIAKARAAGLRVVINTGRDRHEAAWFAREAGCDLLNSSVGGALVSEGERTLLRWDVPEPSGRQAVELCLDWGFDLLIFAGERTLVNSKYKRYLERHYPFPSFHEHAVVTDDPLDYMALHGLPLTKIHGELNPARYPLERLAALPGVTLTTSSSHDVELLAAGADKGRALAYIAAQYGVPLNQCAAVGDSANDLEALRAVGTPVAMGNAPQDVKAAAARVAPSNAEEGVAWAIVSCLEG